MGVCASHPDADQNTGGPTIKVGGKEVTLAQAQELAIQFEVQLQSLKDENSKLQESKDKSQQKVEYQKQQLEKYKNANHLFEERLKEVQEEYDLLKLDYDKLKKENTKLAALSGGNEEVEELLRENDELEQQIERLVSKADNFAQQFEALQAALSEVVQQNQALQAEREVLEQKVEASGGFVITKAEAESTHTARSDTQTNGVARTRHGQLDDEIQ